MSNLAERHPLHEVSYFHEMHKANKGIIALMKLDVNQHHKSQKRCVMRYGRYSSITSKHLHTLGKVDLYFTQNTFKALSKAQHNLLMLNALYIDIDYYKVDLSKDYVLGKIDFLVKDKQIPQPTFIVDSGRGCYLIWKINPVPAQAIKLWRRLEDQFFEALKDLGADASCLDPSRVLRVDGSINSKNGKAVQVIDYRPIVYSINDLQTEYLVPFPHKERKTRPKYTFPKKENILYLNESPSLYHKRLQDIQTLVKIRQGNLTGCRELACFLTRYWTYCVTKDKQLALEAALALNQQLIDPLPDIEVNKWTQSPDKALRLQAYRYSHKRLINLLKITPEEEEQLESILSHQVWEKKRKRRQREQAVNTRHQVNKLTSREQKKLDTQNNIVIYYKKGYSQKDIAKTLGLSVRTVQRHYREIKNIQEDQ